MSLILSNVGVGSWILLGVLLLILIVSPFLMRAKNKKEMENQQKMMDAINKGDTVLTSAGVIGKVVGIDNNKQGYKTLTIETGDEKHKGYMCVDIRSIYYNLSKPVVETSVDKKDETKTESTVVTEKKDDVIEMPEDLTKHNAEEAKTVEEEKPVENSGEETKKTESTAKPKRAKNKKKN